MKEDGGSERIIGDMVDNVEFEIEVCKSDVWSMKIKFCVWLGVVASNEFAWFATKIDEDGPHTGACPRGITTSNGRLYRAWWWTTGHQ